MYPIDLTINYTNDTEYRQQIRLLAGMSNQFIENKEYMDEISIDETDYDETKMNELIDYIIKETSSCDELQELYKLAAATMFSLDISIGVVVLFSFDYLVYFHRCLQFYFKNKFENIDPDIYVNSSYKYLYNILQR